ncbi:MAG: DEAD/DEAH box helicase [Thermoanaerobaculia bacterium]
MDYFRRGRVRHLSVAPDGHIEATVQGADAYNVRLRFVDDELVASCTCPWYDQYGEICKHIWAAVLTASQRHLLPNRELFIDVDLDVDAATASHLARERPAWKNFLDALGPAPPVTRPAASRTIPEQVVYTIPARAPNAQALTLQIVGRARKKNGEWGKWRPMSLRPDELGPLEEFDRTTIALLQRPYSYAIEATVSVAPSTTAWWFERLCTAKRLAILGEDGELQPITWDGGSAWTLRIAIENDLAASMYYIVATIERNGETMPLHEIDSIYPEVVVRDHVAHRFDDGGRGAWLRALRTNPRVEVPHADADKFRQALLRAPMANIELPDDLGWSIVDALPHPVLALQHDPYGAELIGDLSFVYDDWRVSSRSTEMQHTAGSKLIRRNRVAEDELRAKLVSLGVIASWDSYRIRAGLLEQVVRKLSEEKWTIEIDSAPVRVADDVDLELSSGIDWFDLNVSASFGDVQLGLPELLAAAESKRSLLRLADGSYGIVPLQWAESLAPVIELGKRTGDRLRFKNAQALLIDALLASKEPQTDDACRELRARIIDAQPEARNEPPTLNAELRPYQRAGLGWLHFLRETGVGGCLADDMGLGKTVQTLAMLEELRASGASRPSLVVAPRSLLFNWAAEAKKFAPRLRVLEHHGTDRADNVFTEYDVVLTTYATMRLDVTKLAQTEFEYVILDEAQAIKNASSQVAKASQLLRGRHRLALSGTPIENHLGELWSLFEFLNPGLLGSPRMFSRTFAGKSVPPERREALARALRPMILRRTKEQVAPELPERIEQTLYCELEGKQREQYDELRDHYRNALLGTAREQGVAKSRMQILEALLRLRQAASHPALVKADTDAESAKLELLLEELGDVLESGHRALVFSQFTSFLSLVRASLDKKKVEYLSLDGQTRDRQSLVDQFQSDDGPPLFLISLKAGGLGLNLTNADYIFLLDPWWNPAVEAQAIDRAHRIGRSKPVVAYRLIARDTVEEKILDLQARKRELADSILSEDNSVLRKLELEDLELLLA